MQETYEHWLEELTAVRRMGKAFIVGCGKSGTTWVQNLLAGHPEIVASGEGRWGWGLLPGLEEAIREFNKDQAGRLELAQVNDEERKCLLRATIERGFIRYLNSSEADFQTVRMVVDKTPQHAVCITALADLFPEARFVHIVRDPRDVAVSGWYDQGVRGTRSRDEFTRYFITQVWLTHVGSVAMARKSLGDRLIEMRYEDLHADGAGQTRRLLRFLGVNESDDTVAACLASGSFKKRAGGRERGEEDAKSHYRKGVIGDGLRELNEDVVRACMNQINAIAHLYGYVDEVAGVVS